MNFSAVFHRTADNYCYPLNEEEMVINLKTGYDVKQVFLHFADPFAAGILGSEEAWSGEKKEIAEVKKLPEHLWWTARVEPEFKRIKYFFELSDGENSWFYFEDGFYTEDRLRLEGRRWQCFIFPWMNSADINRTPEWVKDTVWYQIFPDRFCNGDSAINREDIRPWKSEPSKNEYHYGGDLAGIISKLDYLAELGINGIYLNPIFLAGSTHKYDTTDYKKIDPEFGDNETFRLLVDEAHKRQIRIMIDGVFNHCGRSFGPWKDVLVKGPESPYYDWFMINKWPFDQTAMDTRDGKFYSFAFASGMPKFNTNNEEVIDYLLDICRYWVEEYDVDGLRLDVANEFSHRFAKRLLESMMQIKPDIYILGEIWHDSIRWLQGDEFHAVMNYPLTSAISDYWLDSSMDREDLEKRLEYCYTLYMEQSNDVMFNLLDSHDTERLIYRTKDEDIFFQQLAVLFTMQGTPCIYYGTEIVLEGAQDPDCRRCMPWKEIEEGVYREPIDTVKQLIHLRRTYRACKSRKIWYTNTLQGGRVVEYVKEDQEGNRIQVILSAGDTLYDIPKAGEILFSRNYSDHTLMPKGILIRKYDN